MTSRHEDSKLGKLGTTLVGMLATGPALAQTTTDELAGSENHLAPIEVKGQHQDGFKTDHASSVKFTAPLVDTPKSVTVIPQALIQSSGAATLTEALRTVHRGGRSIDPQLALEAWSEADPLNDRERQVLRFAGEGLSAGDIATKLNLSHGTVRNYLSEAIGKLGAANRIEAYRLARQKGWL